MSKEAWKDTGKCYECRRKPYCGTQCSARKRYVREIYRKAMLQTPVGWAYTEMNRQPERDGKTANVRGFGGGTD